MLHSSLRSLIVLLSLAVAVEAHGQVAAWADKELAVHDGLQLWLDASRVNAFRKSMNSPEFVSGDAVTSWSDGSASQRVFDQADEKLRPRLVRVGDAWVMRFDGEDDYFRRTGTGVDLQAATVFIVAAPHANPGDFRGLFATNAPDRRDYESGMTIDLGSGPSFKFDQLNIEGKGFGGANDLLNSGSDFGTLHTIEAEFDATAKEVKLSLDGKPEGNRPFAPSDMSFDEVTVGARFYTNGPGAQEVRGPFQGDIAELLVYNRVLKSPRDSHGARRR